MLAFVYVSAFVVALWAPFVGVHAAEHGRMSLTHASLVLFNAINILICLWEQSLFLNRAHIKAEYAKLKKRWGKRLPQPMCLFEHVSLREALTLKYWGIIWSTYSILDPSYSDQTTFGFWIDTGNGVSALLPSLVLTYAWTWEALPARAIGALGLVANWQMLYGTLVYFASYACNARYKGCSSEAVAIVIFANIIWVVFPAWAMVASWDLVD
eukprot:CAMPEP_0170136450 /NCGR_PEP_ID=MMETSP0033_2-20121228/3306_1 /TAXON_ID=195969 /ORGANISM="Dolichomastix tenuilepis, Strain CCMP3274" /LENGTH=211 /DNA_ID=CAMNT_0010372163 /DNA_START=84 /DNA_END=716 /DNA_ORIENTATION=+